MSKICAVTAKSYDMEVVQGAIDKIFDLLDLDKLVKSEYKVLIKPNLLMKRKPSEVTTTHPNVVLAVVNKLHNIGVKKIIIADSPSGLYTKQALNDIYKGCGIKEIVSKAGADVELNYDITADYMYNSDAKVCKTFNIIKPVHDADFIISIGKVKTHGMTTMSGSVKNLFGSIPGLQKPEMHCRFNKLDEFCEMLIDLSLTVKPNISIMDGIEGMEGDGPSGGTPKKAEFIAASENPYELDMFLAKKIGINPFEVPINKSAIQRNLCSKDMSRYDFVGDADALYKEVKFKLPKSVDIDFTKVVPKVISRPVGFILDKLLVSRPVIKIDKCVGCGKCAESCPQHTITIINHKAKINYANCIKCFCCHEMCPIKAIDMKRRINL